MHTLPQETQDCKTFDNVSQESREPGGLAVPPVPSVQEKQALVERIRTNFPPELLALPQWVAWRYESRNDKLTKVPYRATTPGGAAKSNDPATWAPFDVVTNLDNFPSTPTMHGLGFMFAGDVVGVDFDKCFSGDVGALDGRRRAILDALNSYTECSPSGKGLHVYARGSLPTESKHKNAELGIEIYQNRRFFTVTGDRLDAWSLALENRQAEIDALWKDLFAPTDARGRQRAPATPRPVSTGGGRAAVGDDEVLQRLFEDKRNGVAIRRLWDGGDGDDHSAADMRLCNHLAHGLNRWGGGADPDRLDRMFRRSGLMRPKWDERHNGAGLTYGQMTIDKALEGAGAVQSPPARDWGGDVAGAAPYEGGAYAGAWEAEPPDPREIGLGVDAKAPAPPEIDVTLPLAPLMDAAKGAILAANDREPRYPRLYLRAGVPVAVNSRGIGETMTVPKMYALLGRVAHWVKYGERDGVETTTFLRPPGDLPAPLLGENEWPGLPELEGVTHTPVFAPNGTLHEHPGYNPATKLFNASYLKIGDTTPTAANVQAAKNLLLDEYLGDFPFVDDASRAHALALLLLPFMRPMIDGATPLHLVSAPMHGSGKGLLVRAALAPALGREIKPSTELQNNDEWAKQITAWLMEATTAVYIDNLHHELRAPQLATALTEPFWSGRILGTSTNVSGPIRWVWAATGNNAQTTGEIGRRTVLIRLNAKVENPGGRDNFKHPDLMAWATENRAALAAAAITLIRHWIEQGRPLWRQRTKGSFEAWARAMGGVLAACGVPGFLQNEDELRDQAMPEEQAYRLFIDAWAEQYRELSVSTGDLFLLAGQTDPAADGTTNGLNILGDLLGDKNERSRRTIFGQTIMARLNGRIFGRWEVVKVGADRTNGAVWRLRLAPKDPPAPQKDTPQEGGAEPAPRNLRGTCAEPSTIGSALLGDASPEVETPNAEPAEPETYPAYACACAGVCVLLFFAPSCKRLRSSPPARTGLL